MEPLLHKNKKENGNPPHIQTHFILKNEILKLMYYFSGLIILTK